MARMALVDVQGEVVLSDRLHLSQGDNLIFIELARVSGGCELMIGINAFSSIVLREKSSGDGVMELKAGRISAGLQMSNVGFVCSKIADATLFERPFDVWLVISSAEDICLPEAAVVGNKEWLTAMRDKIRAVP